MTRSQRITRPAVLALLACLGACDATPRSDHEHPVASLCREEGEKLVGRRPWIRNSDLWLRHLDVGESDRWEPDR